MDGQPHPLSSGFTLLANSLLAFGSATPAGQLTSDFRLRHVAGQFTFDFRRCHAVGQLTFGFRPPPRCGSVHFRLSAPPRCGSAHFRLSAPATLRANSLPTFGSATPWVSSLSTFGSATLQANSLPTFGSATLWVSSLSTFGSATLRAKSPPALATCAFTTKSANAVYSSIRQKWGVGLLTKKELAENGGMHGEPTAARANRTGRFHVFLLILQAPSSIHQPFPPAPQSREQETTDPQADQQSRSHPGTETDAHSDARWPLETSRLLTAWCPSLHGRSHPAAIRTRPLRRCHPQRRWYAPRQ